MEDVSKYKELFLKEAKQNIEVMNKWLLNFERNPEDRNALHRVFQAVHTLKSTSATMNFMSLSKLCHAIEDVLDALKQEKLSPQRCTDILFRSFDSLSLSLKEISFDREELSTEKEIATLQSMLKDGGGDYEEKSKLYYMYAQWLAHQQVLALAEKSYAIVLSSFRSGKASQTLLNDAELQLTAAKLRAKQSLFGINLLKARIEKLTAAENS